MITKRIILAFLFIIHGYQYSYAQNFLTKEEVYDYEIGDEFHYHLSRPWWMYHDYYIHRVLNKYTTSSHLYYEMGKVDRANGNNILSTFLDSIPLAVLQTPIIDTNSAWGFADTICTSASSIIINHLYNGSAYQDFAFTENLPDNYEPAYWRERYGKGIGRINYYQLTLGGSLSIDLVYFKKDTVVWGDDVFINSTSKLEQQQENWKIFPNPFTNHLSITMDNIAGENFKFLLYNNIGQLVWETKITNPQTINTLDLPTIPIGVYHAILRDDKQQQIIKVVKE